MFSFWDYMRHRWEKDGGLRIDFILLSADLARRVTAAGVDREERTRVLPGAAQEVRELGRDPGGVDVPLPEERADAGARLLEVESPLREAPVAPVLAASTTAMAADRATRRTPAPNRT